MQRVDFRLVILLVIAVLFMMSTILRHDQEQIVPVVIEGDFIDFDYRQVFNLPSEACLEESSLPSRLPVL
jgi:hypothetical protein